MFDILCKAEFQHTVCFIKDQRFHSAAVKVFFFDVLHQASGCRHHNILVLTEHFGVVHIGDTTGDGGDIQMCIRGQFTGMFCDLHG
ncbi:hypothetical protein D3C85_1689800 [compost metagenome]